MDLEPAVALVSTVAGSAATAAGGAAWQSLVGLFRRATGRAGVGPVDPGDEAAVRVLAGQIIDRARSDAEFGARLRQWAEEHGGEVRNTISGDAKIEGPVIQARDIHGGINLG
ncbi:hypothetical protein [Streptomyces gobiensis]|uniref:hypothetical protein n=1 Tax=Streptomyces gobiensis TaxID=2875706 RepID=UPI001E29579F|nr:hypothetical protein [Streptomyces gobiensis]UGY94482.1 hypothetical protein test1122_23945 [Streptomyces gobiensis]